MSQIPQKKPWQEYGLEQGPNGARFDYLYDWMNKNKNASQFELSTVDFRWNDANSCRKGRTSPPLDKVAHSPRLVDG